jgi:hypothetical protein
LPTCIACEKRSTRPTGQGRSISRHPLRRHRAGHRIKLTTRGWASR